MLADTVLAASWPTGGAAAGSDPAISTCGLPSDAAVPQSMP